MSRRLMTAWKKQKAHTRNPPSEPPAFHIANPTEVSLHDIFINPQLSPHLLPLFHACAQLHVMPELPLFYQAYLTLRRQLQPDFLPALLSGTANADDPSIGSLDTVLVCDLINTYVDPHSNNSLNLSGTLRSAVLQADPHCVSARLIDDIAKEAGRAMSGNLLPVFRTYLADWIVKQDLSANKAPGLAN